MHLFYSDFHSFTCSDVCVCVCINLHAVLSPVYTMCPPPRSSSNTIKIDPAETLKKSLHVRPLNQIHYFSSSLKVSNSILRNSRKTSTLSIRGELLLNQHQTRCLTINYMPLIKYSITRSPGVLEYLSEG